MGCNNLSPSLLIQSAEKNEIDIVQAMNQISSGNSLLLSQTSVLSPMGIQQGIVNLMINLMMATVLLVSP